MNITQIENTVKQLAIDITNGMVSKDDFIYELMKAYGHRKTTISRIKSGERNLASIPGEVRAKRHIYFKHSASNEVLSDIDTMKKEPSVTRDKIRFVIATDFIDFLAIDTRTKDTLDIQFDELGKHFDFFLPWAGMEKAVYQGENPADVKAAEKMAKLFDLIKADNFSKENKNDTTALHNLNVFLTRLLFCFFAEDTGIFKDNQFTAELESHTKADGSDVDTYLNRLFKVLNTSKEERNDLPDYLDNFEYVNGGLFSDSITVPKFSAKSRRMLIECGSELDWSGINPDIFGSMIQAVAHPDQRGGMGMHYTSVINIMKVIEPLFLDELYAELDNINENIDSKLKPSRLRKLHDRIANIKVFDPACGSGNFLIIAFKELRKLEMEIMKRLQELDETESQDDLFSDVGLDSPFSRIRLSQFYGIELDDFAHEVAILSLWLAEHQMNVEFKAEFGECEPTLPLQKSGNITSGNALSLNWNDICSNNEGEVFIVGNPPYLGQKKQSKSQKEDIKNIFGHLKSFKTLDYISCWFAKAGDYMSKNCRVAFVTTNSVVQGSHASMLWPTVLKDEKEIYFAHLDFPWKNNAKDKAGVTCVIIGLRYKSNEDKFLYDNGIRYQVDNINNYLANSENIVIEKRSKPLSDLPLMVYGNMALDGGHLLLNNDEKCQLINDYPESSKFLKQTTGANEFIKGIVRWCLWIEDEDLEEAKTIPPILKRINDCFNFRINGGDVAKTLSGRPHQFRYRHRAKKSQIIVPLISSERREYIPMGVLDKDVIIQQTAQVLYDPDIFILGILSSRMHMVWVRAVAGKLETRISYSATICYNTFPIPNLSEEQKETIRNLVIELLIARESYSDKNMSTLYDPDKMPKTLREIHKKLDKQVDSFYQKEEFLNDEERLKTLFNLYLVMTGSKNA